MKIKIALISLTLVFLSACGIPLPEATPKIDSDANIVEFQIVYDDYDDEWLIVVICDYTNLSGFDNSYIYDFKAKAYQQGIKLDEDSIIVGNDNINELLDNSWLTLHTGTSIKVASAYVLRDKISDVEIEIVRTNYPIDGEMVEYGVYKWME